MDTTENTTVELEYEPSFWIAHPGITAAAYLIGCVAFTVGAFAAYKKFVLTPAIVEGIRKAF